MTVSPADFRNVVGNFATGVTVVTTQTQDGSPYGLTVNSFTSVSLDPILILVCLDNRLSGLDAFSENGKFAVNILSEDQNNICEHFATRGTDRSDADYATGETGVPVLNGTIARLECKVTAIHPGGDHKVLLGEVRSAEVAAGREDDAPLLFFRGRYHQLSAS